MGKVDGKKVWKVVKTIAEIIVAIGGVAGAVNKKQKEK